ncbi:MAG: hypothetical protein ABSH24_32165 [Bryobacteraceae bacterium]|jgi:hypothetical protein
MNHNKTVTSIYGFAGASAGVELTDAELAIVTGGQSAPGTPTVT